MEDHTKAFVRVKEENINLTEYNNFAMKSKTKVKSIASHNRIKAFLIKKTQQKPPENIFLCFKVFKSAWTKKFHPSTWTFRSCLGDRSLGRLPLLSNFEIVTDHKALLSALSPNHGSKTYHSRWTRWIDRLSSVSLTIKHIAG